MHALEAKTEKDIDTDYIPEVTDWSGAVVGKFYRPVKKQVTIRIDADVLAWFKSKGGKYHAALLAIATGLLFELGERTLIPAHLRESRKP